MRGISGKFSGAALDALCCLPDVEYIEPDQISSVPAVSNGEGANAEVAKVTTTAGSVVTQYVVYFSVPITPII